MSPRAACRLETLGFRSVHDYVTGKADWLARSLPTEGEQAGVPRARDALRTDAVTCLLEDTMGDVRPRVERSPHGFALVVSSGGVVLGRLRKAAIEGNPTASAADVMEAGPWTVRPDTKLATLMQRLTDRGLTTAIVTTPDGVLLGVVRREPSSDQ